MSDRIMQRTLNHLGALGLLTDCALAVSGPEADDLLDCIERCFVDAEALGMIRWRRVLNRFEIEPKASSVLEVPR
jgi:hypothetical protein